MSFCAHPSSPILIVIVFVAKAVTYPPEEYMFTPLPSPETPAAALHYNASTSLGIQLTEAWRLLTVYQTNVPRALSSLVASLLSSRAFRVSPLKQSIGSAVPPSSPAARR